MKTGYLRVALILSVVVFCLSNVAAQNSAEWPQWRGPNRDGISKETGLLKQWPSDGPPLVWKASGAGTGYSSLAVSGGRIFTMGVRGDREGPKPDRERLTERNHASDHR